MRLNLKSNVFSPDFASGEIRPPQLREIHLSYSMCSMMVNADCKIQNKIKSFAGGQTSNVGRVLHMVKCNEINVKIPM